MEVRAGTDVIVSDLSRCSRFYLSAAWNNRTQSGLWKNAAGACKKEQNIPCGERESVNETIRSLFFEISNLLAVGLTSGTQTHSQTHTRDYLYLCY